MAVEGLKIPHEELEILMLDQEVEELNEVNGEVNETEPEKAINESRRIFVFGLGLFSSTVALTGCRSTLDLITDPDRKIQAEASRLILRERLKKVRLQRAYRKKQTEESALEAYKKLMEKRKKDTERFQRIVGIIDKIMKKGEGIYAIFGIEQSVGLNPKLALKTLTGILEKLETYYEDIEKADIFTAVNYILLAMYKEGVKVTKAGNNCLSDSLDKKRKSPHEGENGEAYWLLCYDFSLIVYMFMRILDKKYPQRKIMERIAVFSITGHMGLAVKDRKGEYQYIDLNIRQNTAQEVRIASYSESAYRNKNKMHPKEKIILLKTWKEVIASVYGGAGLRLHGDGDYFRANMYFEQSLSMVPNRPTTVLNRGAAFFKMQNREEAMKYYSQAIQLNPSFSEAYSNRGVCYEKRDQNDLAYKDYDCAIQSDPNNANAYWNRGGLHAKMKRYDESIQDFDKAVKLDIKDEEFHVSRAGVYLDKGDYVRAIKEYTAVIKRFPKSFRAYYFLGIAYRRSAKDKEALDIFKKAHSLDSTDISTLMYMGEIYASNKQYYECLQCFSKVIAIDENHKLGHYNRGICNYQLGLYLDAVVDFSIEIDIDPKKIASYENRAACYYKLGMMKEATDDYEKSQKMKKLKSKTVSTS